MNKNILYSDIDLSLKKTANSDIGILRNNDCIKTSIMNLLSFDVHDIFLNDNFGGFLKDLLFEADSAIDLGIIIDRIEWIINTYEKRIKLLNVEADFGLQNTIIIQISYEILKKNSKEQLIYKRDLRNAN